MFLKKCQVFGIFWQSNGNFPEDQVVTKCHRADTKTEVSYSTAALYMPVLFLYFGISSLAKKIIQSYLII